MISQVMDVEKNDTKIVEENIESVNDAPTKSKNMVKKEKRRAALLNRKAFLKENPDFLCRWRAEKKS